MKEGFGDAGDQAKICSDIMAKTPGVSIEMSSAKDKSLTVVLTGKADAVMKARKRVCQQLQTQVRIASHTAQLGSLGLLEDGPRWFGNVQ